MFGGLIMEQNNAKQLFRPWVKKKGVLIEADVLNFIIEQFSDTAEEAYFLAAHSDKYVTGRMQEEDLKKIDMKHLLEVRIFSKERELLVSRTMLGTDFSYRIAADEAVEQCYMIDHEQYIDINVEKSRVNTEKKQYDIMSTVGGKYTLPIDEDIDRIKIKSYIAYDVNGMAKVVDHRVAGFIGRKEK